MDEKTWLGVLAELNVATEFHRLGYHVYTQTSGKGPFDLIVVDTLGSLLRVEVKGVGHSLQARLGQIRSNHTGHKVIPFDNTSIDILGIYVEPFNEVFLLDAKKISAKRELTFNRDRWQSLVYCSSLEKSRASSTVGSNPTLSSTPTNTCMGCGSSKLFYEVCCL